MNPPTSDVRLIKIKDFAKAVSISVRQLYRLVDRGELPRPVKQGNCSFFLSEDLDAYCEKLKNQRK